jgi:hypothetical protein
LSAGQELFVISLFLVFGVLLSTHFNLGGGVARKRMVAQEFGSNVTVSVEGRNPLGKTDPGNGQIGEAFALD